jgi:hypothetical protein
MLCRVRPTRISVCLIFVLIALAFFAPVIDGGQRQKGGDDNERNYAARYVFCASARALPSLILSPASVKPKRRSR